MEKLELKHIANYLPYGLKVKDSLITKPFILDTVNLYSVLSDIEHLNTILLVLRPLSTIDLKFFQDNIDYSIENFIINCEPENNHFSVEVCESVLGWSALSFEEYQLFFKYHIDVFGLIDKGLAIDINNLK